MKMFALEICTFSSETVGDPGNKIYSKNKTHQKWLKNEKFYATSKYARFRNSSPFQIPFHNNIAIFFT
jgi:hypothetical protein